MAQYLEKAVSRQAGDVHPNGKWVWTEYKPGKFDWRPSKSKTSSGGSSSTVSASVARAKAGGQGKAMNSQQLTDWAQKTSDDNLLKVANNPNGKAQMRKIAYDALQDRGFDMSKVNTTGSLDQLIKMTQGNTKASASKNNVDVADTNEEAEVDIDDDSEGGTTGTKITEKWYLDQNDKRVRKMFDLDTKGGRIKYDRFMDKMKKKEKDYVKPEEVIQDLNEQYLEFLDNPEQRFMISAGGAGIGKSFGFHKIAELLNMKPFESGDKPGDDDYDYFEAPDVNSQNQLLKILKDHNGKIVLFDDNDKVLRRADCAATMKKATATTGKRILEDPESKSSNFEFTGRIIVMTNKDLAALAENEDTKAVISRAMMVSDIHLTVPETIEVMESRFQDYEFPQAPRLDDEQEDKEERDEILKLIKENLNDIDPRHFTTRTFQSMIVEKRKTDRANKRRSIAAFSKFIGDKDKSWKAKALAALTKANVSNELGTSNVSEELMKAEKVLFEKGNPWDDGPDYTVDDFDEEDEVTKAENDLFGDTLMKAEFSEKERKKLTKKKEAMPDGSYPIRNASDLSNAIQAFGRAKNPAATKRWIKKRAKQLGKEDMLPETWKAKLSDLEKAEITLFGK